jgi:Zn-dependent protease
MDFDAVGFVFQIAILVMSVVIHEVSHGFMAYALGDPTAKYAGRLTLNPIPHIDPFGSIILPLILALLPGGIVFGWAKPVPYNPYNLRNQKWGPGLVAGVGPLANIFVALVFGAIIRFADILPLAVPAAFIEISVLVVLLNIVLAVFNLVPIPPLDGSKVLFTFLPYHLDYIQQFLEQYGFFLLLIFIFFFFQALFPVIDVLFRLFTGISL